MFKVPRWLGCTMEKVSWCTRVTKKVTRRARRRVEMPGWWTCSPLLTPPWPRWLARGFSPKKFWQNFSFTMQWYSSARDNVDNHQHWIKFTSCKSVYCNHLTFEDQYENCCFKMKLSSESGFDEIQSCEYEEWRKKTHCWECLTSISWLKFVNIPKKCKCFFFKIALKLLDKDTTMLRTLDLILFQLFDLTNILSIFVKNLTNFLS